MPVLTDTDPVTGAPIGAQPSPGGGPTGTSSGGPTQTTGDVFPSNPKPRDEHTRHWSDGTSTVYVYEQVEDSSGRPVPGRYKWIKLRDVGRAPQGPRTNPNAVTPAERAAAAAAKAEEDRKHAEALGKAQQDQRDWQDKRDAAEREERKARQAEADAIRRAERAEDKAERDAARAEAARQHDIAQAWAEKKDAADRAERTADRKLRAEIEYANSERANAATRLAQEEFNLKLSTSPGNYYSYVTRLLGDEPMTAPGGPQGTQGTDWWKSKSLGELEKATPEQLASLPLEVVEAFRNEFLLQHPELMAKLSPDRLRGKGKWQGSGFADDVVAKYANGGQTANVAPPWYVNLDHAAMEEKIKADPSLALKLPIDLLESFRNEFLQTLPWEVQKRLSAARVRGEGKWANTGYSQGAQQWVGAQPESGVPWQPGGPGEAAAATAQTPLASGGPAEAGAGTNDPAYQEYLRKKVEDSRSTNLPRRSESGPGNMTDAEWERLNQYRERSISTGGLAGLSPAELDDYKDLARRGSTTGQRDLQTGVVTYASGMIGSTGRYIFAPLDYDLWKAVASGTMSARAADDEQSRRRDASFSRLKSPVAAAQPATGTGAAGGGLPGDTIDAKPNYTLGTKQPVSGVIGASQSGVWGADTGTAGAMSARSPGGPAGSLSEQDAIAAADEIVRKRQQTGAMG